MSAPLVELTPFATPIGQSQNTLGYYGSAIPGILQDPASWNTVRFANVQYAGICKVTGGKRNKLDRKRPPGTKGSQITSLGFEDADLVFTFTIHDQPGDDTQWQSYQRIVALLMKAKTYRNLKSVSSSGQAVNVNPIDVMHPSLRVLGIYSVYIKEIGVLQPGTGDELDVLTGVIKAAEYQPLAPSAVKQVKGSGSGLNSLTPPNASSVVADPGAVPVTGNGTFTPASANFTPSQQALTPPDQAEAGP